MAEKASIKTKFWWITRNILFPLSGVLLLYLAFRGKDYGSIWEAMMQANIWWFFIPRILILVSHWFRAWRWVLQLRPFGHSISIFTAFNAILATFLVNIYLPKIGDFYRSWALKETEKIPVSRSFGTLITEKFIDLIVLLIFFGAATILQYQQVSGFLKNQILGNLQDKVFTLIPSGYWLPIIVGFFAIALLAIYFLQKSRSSQSEFQAKLKSVFQNIWQGMISVKKINNSTAFILLSLGIFFCYWFSFQLCFLAMEGTAHLNLIDSLFTFTISAFGQAAPIQANIGAFHWLVSESLGILKVDAEIALAWATAMHATGIIFRLVTGLFGVLYLRTKGVKMSSMKEKAESEENPNYNE